MKQLSLKSAESFSRIIITMGKEEEIIIRNPPHKSLEIQKLSPVISVNGIGRVYRISKFLDTKEKSSDMSMQFIVFDKRKSTDTINTFNLVIYSQQYSRTSSNTNEISCTVQNRQIQSYNRRLQLNHMKIAEKWLSQLKSKGYFKGSE